MIASLEGYIIHKDIRFVILDVHSVGYKVYVSADTLEKLTVIGSAKVRLFTHLAVREDAMDLYGFLSEEEQKFFELLITISGIGPKSALSILSVASIPTLKKAVASGDPTYLTKVSGIGKKNAEKIVLELKDKLYISDDEHDAAMRDEGDSLEALKAIGYSEKEAREALKKVSADVTTPGERVKQAIKILGKNK